MARSWWTWTGTASSISSRTAPVLLRLARERGVDMPVAEAVAALIAARTTPRDALDALLSRPSRAEAGD